MPRDPEAFADMVVLTVKAAMAPVLERCAALEARLNAAPEHAPTLADLRSRLVALETKSTPVMPSEHVNLALVLERISAAEARVSVLGDVRDRLAVVETKSAMPPAAPSVDASATDRLMTLAAALASTVAAHGELVTARTDEVSGLRDRVVAVETKSAIQPALGDVPTKADLELLLRDRLEPIAKKVDDVEHRVHAVEVKPEPVGKALEPSGPTAAETELALRNRLEPVTQQVAALSERVAVMEVRGAIPGPPGKDGRDGQDGAAGRDGKDGLDGMGWDDLSVSHDGERAFTVQLTKGDRIKDAGTFTLPVQIYRGIYSEGRTYEPGDTVTYAGSLYHCQKTTVLKPDAVTARDPMTGEPRSGQGKDFWKLVVKRGDAGKDGGQMTPLPTTLPVVSVVGGRK
jgi:hypothetical protein